MLITFCFGVAILLLSTQALVKLAERLSLAVQISPLIIGTTVVALGTSLPELTVSAIAAMKNDAGLALGNIIGSNVVNILMVLPAGILIGKLRIGTTKTQRNALLLLGITALFVLLQILSFPPLFSGLLLLTLAVLVTIGEYELGVFGRSHEDTARFKNHQKVKFALGKVISVIISIAGIVLGGLLVVNSVESIATITGYSTTILGLSLTAIATSLPELFTTVLAQEEHQEKVTIGNIVGSNIYNLLFIGGVISLFSTIATIPTIDWVWLILTTICFVLVLRYYSGKPIPKWVGALLLLVLSTYLFTQTLK